MYKENPETKVNALSERYDEAVVGKAVVETR